MRSRSKRPVHSTAGPTVRAAVYTRKSTTQGLDSDFSSLDAQREACLEYIGRQAGWAPLEDRYDDGGFTGANIERPAFRRLLAEVEARRVDVIVVHRVDRLSRSLLDFVKVMERINLMGASFVSVTQNFSTADAMGRLALGMLMTFAEFERSMISERTASKMGASRRRGKWTGGPPILGYDVHPDGGRIVVNEVEGARVREIFALYLAEESLGATVRELNRRGWRTKSWTTRRGTKRPGRPFEKNLLLNLLRSRTYLGQVDYQGTVYPGEHAAIVATDTILAWHRRLIIARGSNPTLAVSGGA